MKKTFFITVILLFSNFSFAQLKWKNVDSLFQPLPESVHVFFTDNPVDTAPFRAYYVIADLKDKGLEFTVDTSHNRRLTPSAFYEKNNNPLLVVNTTFFSFETNRSLNLVIKDKKILAYNIHTINGRGKDTLTYRHPLVSAIGISKKRKAGVAWLYADSSMKYPVAFEKNPELLKDSFPGVSKYSFAPELHHLPKWEKRRGIEDKWKMQAAVGGGPVLIHDGSIRITNNEELKFAGKAINDKHPRTAMGYTKDHKLIILVIEGRNLGTAEGASLIQEAQILRDLGCYEALNLDGGGSSCMLINGSETIKPSDKEGQRSVPAVFIVKSL